MQSIKIKTCNPLWVWEMYENSSLTRKSARKREVTLNEFLPSFTKQINNEKISPRALFAVLTGGLYYVLLRGNRSTFCGLDFSTKSGRKLLAETIFSHPLKTIFQHKACTDKLYADSFYKVQKNSHSSFEVICCRR